MLAIRKNTILALVALLVLPGLAAASTPGDDDRLDQLLERIEEHRDRTSHSLYREIAAMGTKKSFTGLKRVVTWLREEGSLSGAYAAFRGYAGTELEPKVAAYLEKQAYGTRPRAARAVAAATLAELGDAGREAAERVLNKSKNAEVRWGALRPILGDLARRGDLESLELLLDTARPSGEEEVGEVLDALRRFDGPGTRERLLGVLSSSRTQPTLRGALIELYADDAGEDVSAALVECLASRYPSLQRRAIELLQGRPRLESAVERLWSLSTSKDTHVRLLAIEALGAMAADDERWRGRLDALIEVFDDDEVDTIYLLSDGLPSDGELVDPHEIRADIARRNAMRQIEIHGIDLQSPLLAALALGSSTPLVRWLAEDSGGMYLAPGREDEGAR